MMINNYVKISITGKNPRLFIKRYIYNKIKYSNYKEISHNKIIIKITYEDYIKILDKNTIYEINIIKLYGPIKYITLFKNNITFFLASVIAFIYLFILSNLTFDIQVVHNNKEIRKLIMDNLNDNGISKYHLVPDYDKRQKVINKKA